VPVADLHFSARGAVDRGYRNPVDVLRRQSRPQQIVVASDDYSLVHSAGRDHVERFASRNTKPTALSYSKMMHPGMLTQDAPRSVDNFTAGTVRLNSLFPKIGVDKGGVITIRDETDFLR